MAVVNGIRSIDLADLIGTPLAAMVDAETKAAMATVEFIDHVGFLEKVEGQEDKPAELRLVRFRYIKADASGTPAEFTVEVPLLSLLPIPALQIKEAKVQLAARITEVVDAAPTPSGGQAATPAKGALLGRLASRNIRLSTKPVASSGAKDREVRGSYDLDVSITLGQADVTIGLEKILQVLDQAVLDQRSEVDGG